MHMNTRVSKRIGVLNHSEYSIIPEALQACCLCACDGVFFFVVHFPDTISHSPTFSPICVGVLALVCVCGSKAVDMRSAAITYARALGARAENGFERQLAHLVLFCFAALNACPTLPRVSLLRHRQQICVRFSSCWESPVEDPSGAVPLRYCFLSPAPLHPPNSQ